MTFHYAREKAKFDNAWEKTAAWYRAEGMSEDAIRILHDDAWEEFKSNRNYVLHTQRLPSEGLQSEQDTSTLFQKFSSLTVIISEEDFTTRYAWVDTLDDTVLVHKLKKLCVRELEMLTLVTQEGYTQAEAAVRMGIPYRTFKYQWNRLKNFLSNF